jgi:hypothetical protein
MISFSADSLTLGPDGDRVSVYLSVASVAAVAVVLSDPLGLVRFDRDTLIFDKGLTRSDVIITGVVDGKTTIVASDVARLFADDSLALFVGKTQMSVSRARGTPAAPRAAAAIRAPNGIRAPLDRRRR